MSNFANGTSTHTINAIERLQARLRIAAKSCSHRYMETTERRDKDTGRSQTKIQRVVCRRNAECPVCGHCAGCCPGHTMLRGNSGALHAHDSRLHKPGANEMRNVIAVTVLAGEWV